MRVNFKTLLAGLSLSFTLHGAFAQENGDLLRAPDRIEWDAGGLYEGRFSDDTRFQIQLGYPRPAKVSEKDADPMASAYWYQHHSRAQRLTAEKRPGDKLVLTVDAQPGSTRGEVFSVELSADKQSGRGSRASGAKSIPFELKRLLVYRAIVLERPLPEASPEDAHSTFKFSTVFPLLDDPETDAWVREHAGVCEADAECANHVTVTWRSAALMTIDASAWDYNLDAPHGNYRSTVRNVMIADGKARAAGLDEFVVHSPACRQKVSAAIVSKLKAQEMAFAEYGKLDERHDPKFSPHPDGIAFFYDPYEVGSYAQGGPGVFLTRKELGACVKNLPSYD